MAENDEAPVAIAAPDADEKVVVANDEAVAEKPKPMIFAIMRDGHECIREAVRQLKATIIEADDGKGSRDNSYEKANQDWQELKKWNALHMAMEEGSGGDSTPRGFFK